METLEEDIGKILGEHEMAGYVSSMVVDAVDELRGEDQLEPALEELIGEYLTGYEMVAEDDVPALCARLAEALGRCGIGKKPAAKPKKLAAPISFKEDVKVSSWGTSPWGLPEAADEASSGYPDQTKGKPKKLSQLDAKEAAAQKDAEQRRLAAAASDIVAAQQAAVEALQKHLKAREKHGGGWRRDAKVDVTLRSPDGIVLLEDANLALVKGRRYGLIGRNGLGKTTLLRELSSYRLEGFPASVRIHHVEQEVSGDDRPALQCVLEADLERSLLLEEVRVIESSKEPDMARITALQERLREVSSEDAESRAAVILAGLQFTPEMQRVPSRSLSGGWRMRVAIASALFIAPDLLLLDEPTNHLDFPAVLWLQDWLQKHEQTLLVVSHDRGFLDEVATDIVWLANKRLTQIRGNYSSFVAQLAERRLAQQRAYEAQQKEIAHIQEFIDRFDMTKNSSEHNKKTKNHHQSLAQVQARQRMLEKMERVEDPVTTYSDGDKLAFSFPETGGLRKKELVRCQEVAFGYNSEAPPLFKGLSGTVQMGDRVGVLGANGSGKSTLLKVIQGELRPTVGECSLNPNMRWARFAQHHVDDLALHLTAAECLQRADPKMTELEARSALASFGLKGPLATSPNRCLSGGQKSRAALALATLRKPHLLMLDEPTNHLDMDTTDALIDAVSGFEGAVVLVSHDQYFLQKVATVFWSVAKGKVQTFHSLEEAKKSTYSQLGAAR